MLLFSVALFSSGAYASGTLTISGTPASTVAVGSAYSFTPTVKDSLTGRTLAFNIVYKPSWATFSATTGKLSGTPTAANVGKYGNIGIAVNDGINAAVLSSFSITVQSSGGTDAPAYLRNYDLGYAGDHRERRQRLQLHADREGFPHGPHARVQYRLQALLGDLQQHHRQTLRHTDLSKRRQVQQYRHRGQ